MSSLVNCRDWVVILFNYTHKVIERLVVEYLRIYEPT